jgi:hydroxymethylbilane synthase
MSDPIELKLGTRASRMAVFQSQLVADRLMAAHPEVRVELVRITTAGDSDTTTPLQSGSTTGWFTTALQEALLGGRVDFLVHSYKDLPTKRPPGLSLAAIPLRDDPRDAVVSRGKTLRQLAPGARVGTSAPRREAQIRAIRPDLEIVPIRGNVDTRMAKFDAGEYDAIVLALAGLRRIGYEDRVTEILGFEEMLPAPAQGALAVECRSNDTRVRTLLQSVDDPSVRTTVTAERSFLAALEAGCSFPAGAHAEEFGSTVKLNAMVAQNGHIYRSKMGGPAETAAGLGTALATELMQLANQG